MSALRTARRAARVVPAVRLFGPAAFSLLVGTAMAADLAAPGAPLRPVARSEALSILRSATEANPDARRMLASLREEPARAGPAAIDLYLAAQRAGDERARARLDVLREQGAVIPFASVAPAPTSFAFERSPDARDDDPRAPGYHCHAFKPGQMFCHSGID